MLEIDPTTLMLPAILAMTALALLMNGIALVFQIRRSRLPDATRYEHVRELRAQEETLLETRRAELSEVEQKIQERDRLFAEVGALEERYEALKAELAILEPARQEIEEVKADAARAAETLAVVVQELGEKQAELAQIMADLDPAHLTKLREESETLTAERKGLMEALPELRAERDAALRLIEEARLLAIRQEVLKEEITRLEAEITQRQGDRNALREVEEKLARTRDEMARSQDEVGRLAARRDSLSAEIEILESREDELTDLRKALQEVGAELAQKRVDRDVLAEEADRLVARIEGLKTEQERLSGVDAIPGDDLALEDLTKPPACFAVEREAGVLEPVLPETQPPEQEADALQRVMAHLAASGLEFPTRTVNAFHTSLKTAVISPLTVLAGISGTGKSQLPRYYADAMGMHFLKTPVQPRWDSPQDLFGFYNYIEKRYKATDLARALVHLDSYNWEKQAELYKNRILLVLLDEMNLARVEYYFSEFLSRLEGRPFEEDIARETDRRSSEIDIDVSREGQTKRVYAGQNVLFVGTMNEDESTLALSDKVLDRANVLRFPKPVELKNSLLSVDNSHVSHGYLPKERWMTRWIRTADVLSESQRARATSVISQINNVMDKLGRPFGHRMSQAMLHYVANYPVAKNQTNDTRQVDFGLADQIEQRIMPRLRGVLVDDYRGCLLELSEVAGRDLNDKPLEEEIEKCVNRSCETNGLFVWRGFTRQV